MKKQRIVVLVVLIVFSLNFAALGVPWVKAAGGLALDGAADGSAGNLTVGSTTCATSTTTLTTSNKPDVIVALLLTNDTFTKVTSVTDTKSLTWNFRSNKTAAEPLGAGYAQIFEYYAISSGRLSGDTVTFTITAAEAVVCTAFGVSGANTLSPFDSNALIPNSNNAYSSSATLTYTTTNPSDFLIYFIGFCAFSVGQGQPVGFTPIKLSTVLSSNCGSDYLRNYSFYKIVSTIQSTHAIAMTVGSGTSPWAAIGDAIQSTPYVSSISPVHGLPGSSITIMGTSFTGTTSVDFCGAKATFTVISDSSITATLPYCDAGNNLDITVTNAVGTSPTSSNDLFYVDPSPPLSASVIASPTSLSAGEKVTFAVSTIGGYGTLSYSYANLPAGCLSANTSSVSCYPTSSGNYRITVTVTDRSGKSATAAVSIIVGPQRVLGLPLAAGLAVIFGATVGIGTIAILSVALALRRKKRRQASITT